MPSLTQRNQLHRKKKRGKKKKKKTNHEVLMSTEDTVLKDVFFSWRYKC